MARIRKDYYVPSSKGIAKTGARALAFLNRYERGLRTAEVAEALQVSKNAAALALSKLVASGEAERIEAGLFRSIKATKSVAAPLVRDSSLRPISLSQLMAGR